MNTRSVGRRYQTRGRTTLVCMIALVGRPGANPRVVLRAVYLYTSLGESGLEMG